MTIEELARTTAPEEKTSNAYVVVLENFEQIKLATYNGWDWETITRSLGLPSTESGSIAKAFNRQCCLLIREEAAIIKKRGF